jgi:RHS repeat-associated protein
MKTNSKHIRLYGVFLAGVLLTQAAYAFYNPSTGRWLSRDPIQEKGGNNLSRIADNDVVNRVDPVGNCCVCASEPWSCFIGVRMGAVTSDYYYIPELKPPHAPGRFEYGFEVTVTVEHLFGESVEGCHLAQYADWHATFPFLGATDQEHYEDYSPTRSATWTTYHGWWLYDHPMVNEQFTSRPQVPQQFWIQFHDFVTEAPAVEVWWGFAATADYSSNGQSPWGSERWSGQERDWFSPIPRKR